jgi:hypothetical protein
LFAAAGFPLDRWAPYRKARCWFYALLLLTAFIFDLNKVTFESDWMDIVFWSVILVAISELFWISVRKKSRLLLGGALVMFVPVFVYVYFALLMILPMPCHENQNEVVSGHDCGHASYVLKKRLSFDIFKPARVYTLIRDIKRWPIEMQVDKFPAPKGYIEAQFEPRWQCLSGKARNGVQVDLYIDGYTLWSLKEEPREE